MQTQPENDQAAGKPVRTAFISHASKDAAKAQEIAACLEAKGLVCWIAPRDIRPGEEYGEEIMHGIRGSRCMVLVLSEAANDSPMVRREVERAVSLTKPVFPIRIEEVLPSKSLEFFVSSTHWVDAWDQGLAGHVDRLSEFLLNDSAIHEAVGIVQQKRRRRSLFRGVSMGGAAMFVLVLVTLLFVIFKEDASDAAFEDPVRLAAQTYGFDIDSLGKDDIKVRLDLGSPLPSIVIDGNEDVLALGSTGLVQGRVGDGKWESIYSLPIDDGMGYILKDSDYEKNGPFDVRFAPIPGNPGKVYGPFTFEIGLQAERDRAEAGELDRVKAYAKAGDWLVRHSFAQWEMRNEGAVKLVMHARKIEFGLSPDQLDISIVAPTTSRSEAAMPPGAEMPDIMKPTARGTDFRFAVNTALSPHSRSKVMYAKVTFIDGSTSELIKFSF